MKFARVKHAGTVRIGVVNDDVIALLPAAMNDLTAIIERGEEGLGEVRKLVQAGGETLMLESAALLAPLGRFHRDILCTGWNYLDHFNEGTAKRENGIKELPKAPTFFTKGPNTVVGPTERVAYDEKLSPQWDYEGELVVIIGKKGRSIPQNEVANHIFGYTLANDISQRDLQKRHGGQWLKGKSIDDTMPFGPFVVTCDEVSLPDVRLQTLLNGEVMQDASIRQMAFPIERLIAELSLGMTLLPGDVLLTGTPSGVGFARNPPIYLREGDEVIVRASGLGELKNRLEAVDLFGQSDISL